MKTHYTTIKIAVIGIFLLTAWTLSAQETMIAGIVTDPNGHPVELANIVDRKTKTGTTSDASGRFSLLLPKQNSVLQVSHVAFQTTNIAINKARIENGELFFEIKLLPKIEVLPEAVIVDQTFTIAYDDAKKWILDYEIVGKDSILLLLIEKQKRYVQLVNSEHEVLASLRIPSKFKSFHKDPLGFVYLVSSDVVYQLFYDNGMELYHPVATDEFQNIMAKIVFATEQYLFWKEEFPYNQHVRYSKIDRENMEITVMCDVMDRKVKEQHDQLKDLKRDSMMVQYDLQFAFSGASALGATLAAQNAYIQQKHIAAFNELYRYILSIPPYAPLCYINDNLHAFSHVEDKIAHFDLTGIYLSETPIDYHKNSGWQKNIIVDEENSRCFAAFEKNGRCSLKEINPDTGKIIREIVLEKHLYPKKISVCGNYVYYLARDFYQNEEKYFLWRQQIK